MSNRFNRIAGIIIVMVLLMIFTIGVNTIPSYAGTPDDEYLPERYFNTNDAQQSTNVTSYQDALSITFTASASKDFLVLVTALSSNSSTSYSTILQLDINGTGYSETYNQPLNTSMNWRSFETHKAFAATADETYTISIQYKTENSASTAYIKNCSLAVLEISNYYNSESNSESSTSSASMVGKTSLIFTPPSQANYIIFFTADTWNESAGKACYASAAKDGIPYSELTTVDVPYSSCMRVANETSLTADSHTFVIEYKTDNGGTAYIKDARITAVLASDLGDNYYALSSEESSTALAAYDDNTNDKVTLTMPNLPARNDYLVLAQALGRQERTDYGFYGNLDIDGDSYGETVFVAPDRDYYKPFTMMTRVNLTADTHTIKIQYKSSNAASNTKAFIKSASILAIKVNTMESYTGSAHATVDNSYQQSDTVYTWSHGLESSSTYDVAYYDAGSDGGQKVATDSNCSSTAYGNLSSSLILGGYPDATAGIWHSVVFRDGSTPPANYDATSGTGGYVTADSFEVINEGQKWYLSGSAYNGTAANDGTTHVCKNIMSETAGSSATSVALPPEQRAWWYSNEAALVNVSFGSGTWTAQIYAFCNQDDEETAALTVSLWQVASDGTVTSPFASQSKSIATTTTHTSHSFTSLTPESSAAIPIDSRIGCSVEWAGINSINVGFNNDVGQTDNSWIKSPSSDPGYPSPEPATIILSAIGIAAIAGFLYWNHRQRKKTTVS